MAIVHFPLKLVARRMVAPTVAHLSFVRDDGLPLDFIPGQFLQVHFPLAAGTQYWKLNGTRWQTYPATLDLAAGTATFALEDGGPGDDGPAALPR